MKYTSQAVDEVIQEAETLWVQLSYCEQKLQTLDQQYSDDLDRQHELENVLRICQHEKDEILKSIKAWDFNQGSTPADLLLFLNLGCQWYN